MKAIFTTGSSYWANYLARHLNEISHRATSVGLHPFHLCRIFGDFSRHILVVGIGGDLTAKKSIIWTMLAMWWLAHRRRGSITLYWIGGDVVTATLGVSPLLRRLWAVMGVKHIAGAPWFVEELAEAGVDARYVLFPYDTSAATAMRASSGSESERLSVLCYLLPSAWGNLSGRRIMRLATLTPNSDWTAMGMGKGDVPHGEEVPANVKFIGWVDNPLEVLAANDVFIRLVAHDAYSGMVRDAQAMGKLVIYNMPVRGVVDPTGMDDETLASALTGEASTNVSGLTLPDFSEQVKSLSNAIS